MAAKEVAAHEPSVGVRELKAKLSEHLDRVKAGATFTVTERGKPIARLVPIERIEPPAWLKPLLESGAVRWSGLPLRPFRQIKLKGEGPTGSQMISEGREDRF
ncbi:MAG TPA: type II toxin-antitoxin system prevent-host-death family antitoxin [Chloroflexota bacterium]|nr:type II toxin-antitoxin system prevent-host-death family antitoxin [Chloroflexota bacterium]